MARIVSNFQSRPLVYAHEFGEEMPAIRREFDYLTEELFNYSAFFKFRGVWYCMADFLRLTYPVNPCPDWGGYFQETAWSAVIVKVHGSNVIVGRYIE